MARYKDEQCRRCRREGQKLFLKGERCYSDKCSVSRRNYAPGQHGQKKTKLSEYGTQLREKQKTKAFYGVSEKQFRKYFDMASNSKGKTGEVLLQILESRLDNVIYRLGYGSSRAQARMLVTHGTFEINGHKVDIPSYLVKAGDVVTVKAKSSDYVKTVTEMIDMACAPAWMTIDKDALKITFDRIPEREELDPEIKEQLVIEYYSK